MSGSTTTAMLAASILRPAPGREDRAQPDLLEGRPRDRARARWHADPHPGGPLVHQAGHGRDRRHLRRRALRALLLPRQLPRRLRHHRRRARARAAVEVRPRRSPSCACPFERYAMSGEINTRVADPARGDRAGRRRRTRTPSRTASTASPSTSATGGSTCGRATPNRCCASTSRRPTAPRATRTPPRCSRSSAASNHLPEPQESRWRWTPSCSRSSRARRTRARCSTSRTSRRSTTRGCKRRYAVRDDIPIMLIDEAETVDDAEARAPRRQGRRPTASSPRSRRSAARGHRFPRLRRGALRLPEQLAAAHEAAGKVAVVVAARRRTTSTTSSPSAWAAPASPATCCRRWAPRRCPVPVTVLKHYRTPAFVGPRTLAFALSYSGDTEETLEMARGALAAGATARRDLERR